MYARDPNGILVNTDGSTINESAGAASGSMMAGMEGMMPGASGNFEELLPGNDGAMISGALTDSYEVLYGTWPEAYNEVVQAQRENPAVNVVTGMAFEPSGDAAKIADAKAYMKNLGVSTKHSLAR